MMAAPACNKIFYYKISDCLEVGRTDVLLPIFALGTPMKNASHTLDKYLQSLPATSTANYVTLSGKAKKGLFNATELQLINHDPSCSHFDISLLYKAIKVACESLEDYYSDAWTTPSGLLEYKITAIKDRRNHNVHGPREVSEQDYYTQENELKLLFIEALTAAKNIYNMPDAEFNTHVQTVIQKMLQIRREEIRIYHSIDDLRDDFIKVANSSLENQLKKSLNMLPIAFITSSISVPVTNVFTEIKVAHGHRWGKKQDTSIDEMLSLAQQPLAGTGLLKPQILLVEGAAGSGKTTLVSFVISEWLKSEPCRSMRGLHVYDVLLEVHCRERGITSLKDLLEKRIFPISHQYKDECMILFLKCKTLIILDGVDEENQDSKELIDDILKKTQIHGCLTLLVTTRPESVESFEKRVSKIPLIFYELQGIHESRRKDFVREYHKELVKLTGKSQQTNEFLQKIEQILVQDYLKLPLNLVIITWVHLFEPEAVTATITQTKLYIEHGKIIEKKLLDRLAKNPFTSSVDEGALMNKVQKCRKELHKQMLLALSHSELTLEEDRETRIREICYAENVPPEELLSAFLSLRTTWAATGEIKKYSAPHKGFHDFYAALYLVDDQISGSTTAATSITWVLQKTLGRQDMQLQWLQNVIHHVAGLYGRKKTLKPSCVTEILDLYSGTGHVGVAQYLDILMEMRLNPVAVECVAKYFPIGNITVTYCRLRAYIVLLRYLRPCTVSLKLRKEPAALEELITALARHTTGELCLGHHYRGSEEAVTSDNLLHTFSRTDLRRFAGHLTVGGLAHLPHSLTHLALFLPSNKDCCLLITALSHLTLPHLEHLYIHVIVATATSHMGLTPLPDVKEGCRLWLVLSGVGDHHIKLLSNILAALEPPSGYWVITFPQTTVTGGAWQEKILPALSGRRVKAGVEVPETAATQREEEELFNLFRDRLGCDFARQPEWKLFGDTIKQCDEEEEDVTMKRLLDAMEEPGASPSDLQHVANHFPTGGDIEITDSRVECYTALLPHLPPTRVALRLTRKPTALGGLLESLRRHTVQELRLHHHYTDPTPALTSNHFLQELPKADLWRFAGHLTVEGLAYLPHSLTRLALVLPSNKECSLLLPALSCLTLPHLEDLWIHVIVAGVTSLTGLAPLPDIKEGCRVWLVLSGVGDCQIQLLGTLLAALEPPSGYWIIAFPKTTVTGRAWQERILPALIGRRVRWGVEVPEAAATQREERELFNLFKDRLGCYFTREPEDMLWAWWGWL